MTVFVNCLVKSLGVGGDAPLDSPLMVCQIMCVLCL